MRRAPTASAPAVVVFGGLAALYFVSRYAGLWAEGDTVRLGQSIYAVQQTGALAPAGAAYQHGYGYQAVATALLAATGLSLQALQLYVFPLVAAVGLSLVALALYRRLTGGAAAGALATLLLWLQPDFLFVTLRGSHEKLGWPLLMLAVLLLHASLNQPLRRLAVNVGLFYLVTYALIAVNVFFASVFLSAVTLGLLLGTALTATLSPRRSLAPAEMRRLVYVAASSGVLIFTFIAYLYAPAQNNLRLLNTIAEKVSALLLSFEVQGQPYNYIVIGWINTPTYLGLTAFTWLLIAASLAEWLRRGWRLLARQETLSLLTHLDWLLYAGFALQVGASIIVDLAGVLGGNLQLRVFPGFTVLAVALVARGLFEWLMPMLKARAKGRWMRAGWALTGLAVVWFAAAAALKATNDPAVSNKWVFYSVQEATSLDWADTRLHDRTVWTSFDERLSVAFDFNHLDGSAAGNSFAGRPFDPSYRYVLLSEIERLRAIRLGQAMPPVSDWTALYDSGQVQLYHVRPTTPFQR